MIRATGVSELVLEVVDLEKPRAEKRDEAGAELVSPAVTLARFIRPPRE